MSETARPTRRYDATNRRRKAETTKARIIECAQRMFLEHGYVDATIPRIAAGAGVAVETVYRAADGKAGLLAAAVQAALAGGVERAQVPVTERPGIRRVIEADSPHARLVAYAATQPGVWSRVGPLLRVLADAGDSDASLVALREELDAQRLVGLRGLAGLLAERGDLAPGLTVDRAADLIWTICAQANYDALVTSRGWSHDEYRAWLVTMLEAALHAPTRR